MDIYEYTTYGPEGFKKAQKRWAFYKTLKTFREQYGFDLSVVHADGSHDSLLKSVFGEDKV